MAITDRREQNLWFAFISAFFGAMSATLYYIIQYLAQNGTPNTEAEREVFSSIVTGSSLSLLISFLIFIVFWALVRRKWLRQPHNADNLQERKIASLHKEYASPIELAESKTSPHKKFLALAIGIMALIAITTVIYANEIWSADAYARYSFAVSSLITLLVAVLLGLYFWHLQKQDNENTQKILAKQNAIIEKVDQRETRQKQFWLNEARKHINTIIDTHHFAATCCRKVLNDNSTQSLTNERASLNIELLHLETWFIPQLDKAMTQVADLIEPSLFENISHNNYGPFKTLISTASDSLENRDVTQNIVRLLEERANVFRAFVERIDNEMPRKAL